MMKRWKRMRMVGMLLVSCMVAAGHNADGSLPDDRAQTTRCADQVVLKNYQQWQSYNPGRGFQDFFSSQVRIANQLSSDAQEAVVVVQAFYSSSYMSMGYANAQQREMNLIVATLIGARMFRAPYHLLDLFARVDRERHPVGIPVQGAGQGLCASPVEIWLRDNICANFYGSPGQVAVRQAQEIIASLVPQVNDPLVWSQLGRITTRDFYQRVGNQGYAAQALNNQLCYCTTDQFEGHKFVQLIFLNWAKSDKAPDAPYLDGKAKFYVGLLRALTEIATTQNNEQGWAAYVHLARIRSNLILNSAIMLSYWGIGYRIGQGFYEANQRLYTKVGGERGNHNMLRMTRFLHTLVLFGYDILARRLYNDLLCHAQNPKSRSHYSKAIGGCPLAEFWRLDM